MVRSLFAVLALAFGAGSFAQSPPKPPPKPAAPRYVDDKKQFDDYLEKLTVLAKAKKCLSAKEMEKKVADNVRLNAAISLAPSRTVQLAPEDVYDAILPSVVILGSIKPTEDDPNEFEDGGFGTAWCVAADGIFVTNYHMFKDAKTELFGIATHKGDVYPVTDLLAIDEVADVAVFRVGGKGFIPLPVAEKPARVGSWVGTLGHPGNNLFTFTQGHVTRYSKEKTDAGTERWMGVTAEYAQGSSGGPVVDRFGNVVGMAALTVNLDAIDEAAPEADPKEKPDKPKPKPDDPGPAAATSSLQMVVKLTVPVTALRKSLGAK